MSALHPDPTQLLKDWLDQPEVKAKLQAVSDRAIAAVWEDTQLRVPRTPEERKDEFALWLAAHRERYLEFLHQELEKEFPGIGKHLEDPYDLWRMVVQGVWELTATELKRFAIRGLAFRWVRDHYRDTIYPGEPEFVADGWQVSLKQKSPSEDFDKATRSDNEYAGSRFADVISLPQPPLGIIFFDIDGNFINVDAEISPREPRTPRQPYRSERVSHR